MWNFLLETHDVGVVGGQVGESGGAGGYGVPTGEFTATDGILLFFVILGVMFFMYLVIKFGIYLFNRAYHSDDDKDEYDE